MRLSKKGQYAVRAMIALGGNADEPVRIGDIARAQRIPQRFLEQILLTIKAAGLLMATPGRGGGYRLKVPASEINLCDILDAVGEPVVAQRLPTAEGGETRQDRSSALSTTSANSRASAWPG